MHGLGNDFVLFDFRRDSAPVSDAWIRLVADRRHGVGCDQVVVLEAPATADGPEEAVMRIYNPDGSEAGACGNAARCVARLLMEESGRDSATLRTRRGVLTALRTAEDQFMVDMGAAQTAWRDVPLARDLETLRLPITDGPLSAPTAVGMGNPHCVFFVSDADRIDLERLGPRLERHPLFPERTNVEVVSLRPDGALRVRVWERGAGLTPACGSGACAALVAAARRGVTAREARLIMDGGTLEIVWWAEDDHVLMTGPAAFVFRGEIAL